MKDQFTALNWFGLAKNGPTVDAASKPPKSPYELLIWPFSVEYFNPLHPIFLSQVSNLEFFRSQKTWYLRDGLRHLCSFFKMHPDPGSLNCHFYVHKKFQPWIPQKWNLLFRYYELCQIKNSLLPSYYLVSGLIQKTPEIKWQNPNSKKNKTFSFIYQSHGSFIQPIENFSIQETTFTPLDWVDLAYHLDLSRVFCWDITSPELIGENYLNHLILSKGGQIQSIRKCKSSDIDIFLSPYHGLTFVK